MKPGVEILSRTWASVAAALALSFALPASAGETIDKASCTFHGKPLYGKIKVVEDFPDLKVKLVTDFPDLKVKKVEDFPDACGKWKLVSDFPDLKVKFVADFPDVKIKYVEDFPGVR